MSKITFFTLVMLMASSLVISCNSTEKTEVTSEASKPAFNLAEAKKAIEENNRVFMELVSKADSVGISNLYTSDAKLMFTGAPAAVGKESIKSVFSGILKSGVTRVELKTIDVFGTEELLAEDGVATIYVKDTMVGEEKYIVLWKQEEGQWKILRDITNSNTPEPAGK
jgi:ketosteroid isomerase-like protein